MVRQNKARWKRIGLAAALVALVWTLNHVPSGYLVVSPGPVIHLSEVVEIEGYPSQDASFYMVSVVAKEATILQCFRPP